MVYFLLVVCSYSGRKAARVKFSVVFFFNFFFLKWGGGGGGSRLSER